MTTIPVIGKNGQVGTELPAALHGLGHVTALGRADMDLTDADAIRTAIRTVEPSIIINAAGYTIVDKAESEPALAMQVNAVAPGIMAEESKPLGALLVHYWTDYVFDGTAGRCYTEADQPHPLGAYAVSKYAGELYAQGSASLPCPLIPGSSFHQPGLPEFLAESSNRMITSQAGTALSNLFDDIQRQCGFIYFERPGEAFHSTHAIVAEDKISIVYNEIRVKLHSIHHVCHKACESRNHAGFKTCQCIEQFCISEHSPACG